MAKVFYVRNIPEQLHRELKAQAALQGVLTKIWNLNLTLISVNRLETRAKDTV